ncbi:outer membrane lipoprotein carrier protein LolA [Kangiella marina]|uniref:Outer membrane lipoprotein carrier protein LolA n=1 Tax=Kangiella marina TaxID=1079178 RepID=A0ABP8IK69_9GAMM
MRIVSLLLFAFFLLSTAQAEDSQVCDLDAITASIQNQDPLHSFEQEKHIAVLSKPLPSSGYLLLTEQGFVVWQTTKPIKSTTVIGNDSFQQFNKNDQPVSLPGNAKNQTSELISSTFLAILSGNLEALHHHFNVQSHCQEQGWALTLTPSNSEIERLLKQIYLSGEQRINELHFTEANDDKTVLHFSSLQDSSLEQQLGQYLVD